MIEDASRVRGSLQTFLCVFSTDDHVGRSNHAALSRRIRGSSRRVAYDGSTADVLLAVVGCRVECVQAVCKFCPRPQGEFAVDPGQVGFHGLDGHEQCRCGLLIRVS